LEDFVGAKFYCPHALADGNQRTWISTAALVIAFLAYAGAAGMIAAASMQLTLLLKSDTILFDVSLFRCNHIQVVTWVRDQNNNTS